MSEDQINLAKIYYNAKSGNLQSVICLKVYEKDLDHQFFIVPQIIFLLYDISKKESLDKIINFYKECQKDSKLDDIKYIIIGNKKDLFKEKEEAEKIENLHLKQDISNNSLKKIVKDFMEENKGKICFEKDISGLTGEGINDLLNDLVNILFEEMKSIRTSKNDKDESKLLDKELNFSSQSKSYFCNEYKEEVKKINRSNRCCLNCLIV